MTLDVLRCSVAKDALLQAADGKYVPFIVDTEWGPFHVFVSLSSWLRNKYSVCESHYAALFGLNHLELEDLMLWNLDCVPPYVALLRWYKFQAIVFSVFPPAHDLFIKWTTSEVPDCILRRSDWRWRCFDDSEVVLLDLSSNHGQGFYLPCMIRRAFGLFIFWCVLAFQLLRYCCEEPRCEAMQGVLRFNQSFIVLEQLLLLSQEFIVGSFELLRIGL